MKQKHSTVTEDVSEWSEVEREYAQLLLVLHRGCLLNQIPYTWGCKRKRSAIQDSSFPSSSSSQTHHASASKANTSSPITPLSFPVTESDDSPSKISLKRVFFLSSILAFFAFRYYFLSVNMKNSIPQLVKLLRNPN